MDPVYNEHLLADSVSEPVKPHIDGFAASLLTVLFDCAIEFAISCAVISCAVISCAVVCLHRVGWLWVS